MRKFLKIFEERPRVAIHTTSENSYVSKLDAKETMDNYIAALYWDLTREFDYDYSHNIVEVASEYYAEKLRRQGKLVTRSEILRALMNIFSNMSEETKRFPRGP